MKEKLHIVEHSYKLKRADREKAANWSQVCMSMVYRAFRLG